MSCHVLHLRSEPDQMLALGDIVGARRSKSQQPFRTCTPLCSDFGTNIGKLSLRDIHEQSAQALTQRVGAKCGRVSTSCPRRRLEKGTFSSDTILLCGRNIIGASIGNNTVAKFEWVALSFHQFQDGLLCRCFLEQVGLRQDTHCAHTLRVRLGSQLQNLLAGNVYIAWDHGENAIESQLLAKTKMVFKASACTYIVRVLAM